jgi:uncharacterized SAM-binding protein YcdF (DUF218 family)
VPDTAFNHNLISPDTSRICVYSANRCPAAESEEPVAAAHYILFFLIGWFILLYYAPVFLTYSDRPVKSDAVVLFIGADSTKRHEEADLLLTEGYAAYQIIPAYRKIRMASFLPPETVIPTVSPQKQRSIRNIRKYFENTHIEVLEAKRMMEQYGFKTAVFVSSPYHMRRIKIMSEKVFADPSYRIVFVPARSEKVRQDWLSLTKSDMNFIAREYVKILWFLIYSR